MKITDDAVRALKLAAGQTDRIEFDDKLPGFGVRVRAGTNRVRKSYIAQYRFGTVQRRMVIGTTEEITAPKARKEAGDILAKARLGTDAQAARKAEHDKAADKFSELKEAYLVVKRVKLRGRSIVEVERHLNGGQEGACKYWATFHSRSVHSIGRADVAARLVAIAEESGDVAANRARATLGAMYAWAMTKGMAEANPVIGTEKLEESSRTRILTAAELVDVWNACGDDDYGRIVRLLMLTGQRRQEVGGITDVEIDEVERQWKLPAERTKNKHEHIVPLSDAALAVLRGHPRREGRTNLFGTGEGAFSGWSKARTLMDERIAKARAGRRGVKAMEPWVLHDLRRTMATGMARLKVLPHVIEAVINHHRSGHQGGVAGVYNLETYLPEKRQALDLWADHVLALVAGKASNIVPMRA